MKTRDRVLSAAVLIAALAHLIAGAILSWGDRP